MTIESRDEYADLHSVGEVVSAWLVLAAVWNKLFPHWPVALIALRAIHAIKNFSHCAGQARSVAVDFSDRALNSNAQRVANDKGPLPYDKTMA